MYMVNRNSWGNQMCVFMLIDVYQVCIGSHLGSLAIVDLLCLGLIWKGVHKFPIAFFNFLLIFCYVYWCLCWWFLLVIVHVCWFHDVVLALSWTLVCFDFSAAINHGAAATHRAFWAKHFVFLRFSLLMFCTKKKHETTETAHILWGMGIRNLAIKERGSLS